MTLTAPLTIAPLLQDCRYFESRDIDDTRERIAHVLSPHRLLPVGPQGGMRSHMNFLQLEGLAFGSLHYGSPMGVLVPQMSDRYLIILCLRGSGLIRTNGKEIRLDARHGFACSPGLTFDAQFSADCEQFFVRMDRATLQRHSGLAEPVLALEVDLERPALMPWQGLVRMLMTDPALLALVRANPRVVLEYEQLLVSLLLAGQPHRDRVEDRRGSVAPAAVIRAERFIEAHATDNLNLEQIAAAAGVSSRALLKGFARFRETSPIRHLRDVRLEMAHLRLQEDAPEAGRVAAVAAECGFGHLGRFSQEYRNRFGELPSETVGARRRARRPTLSPRPAH
jgi:AraC-like DNA-binding protein